MKTFITRVASAAVAIILLISAIVWGGHWGYELIIASAVILGGLELVKILFNGKISEPLCLVFYSGIIGIYITSYWTPSILGLTFALVSICFCLFTLTTYEKYPDLKDVLLLQSKAVLGFFYLGLLPSFAHQLLKVTQGPLWFLSLLSIVFAGDIGAYLVGVKFGKVKILPAVSPKKTIEGALGGLLFSGIASIVCASYLHQRLAPMLLLGLSAAIVAQFGDFFESLLKRIADVKDSGKIMPGHGGVLDRIDGVLFASPVIFLGALILEGLI